jgi:hypothetical protein
VERYTLRSINSLILFGIRKNCPIGGRSLLLYQFTRRAMKLTVVVIKEHHFIQNVIPYPSLKLSPYFDKIVGDLHCGFQHNRSISDQILCINQILEIKWQHNERVYQLLEAF